MKLPARSTASTELIRRPTLGVHIAEIIALCAKPKMLRVYASAIVASVTDAKTIWNLTSQQTERKSVRIFKDCGRTSAGTDAAITIASERSEPNPAAIRLANILPKPTNGITRFPLTESLPPKLWIANLVQTIRARFRVIPTFFMLPPGRNNKVIAESAFLFEAAWSHASECYQILTKKATQIQLA